MKTMVHVLEQLELWMENIVLKKAMEAFGAEANSTMVTEAMKMSNRNAIATKIVTPLPRDVVALPGRI